MQSMQSENPQNSRIPWNSVVGWSLFGLWCLPTLSAVTFSMVYNVCLNRGLVNSMLFHVADEGARVGQAIFIIFHAPLGFLLGAIGGYCWGVAKDGFTRRAYLVSHWCAFLIANGCLAFYGLNVYNAQRGWILFAFLWGFPLIGAVVVFSLSYKFRQGYNPLCESPK
jgi:hypothetical protein